MSDLFSDAAREERRYEATLTFLGSIARTIGAGQPCDTAELDRTARSASVWHELDERGTEGLIRDLQIGDEDRWLWLLELANATPLFSRLHEISPFRHSLLIFGRRVRYGSGIELDVSQLKDFIRRIAGPRDDLPDRFAVQLPFPVPGTTRIIKK